VRVLFDITHPADVHLFRYVMARLRDQGHQVLVASREKDVAIALLDDLGIPHVCLGKMGRGLVRMGQELVTRNLRMLSLARRFRPDVMLSRIGISIGLPGAILRVPRIVVEDTEHARLQLALSLPLATHICMGLGYLKDYGPRQRRFRAFPVQAYLDRRYFTPSKDLLRRHGFDPDEPYVVLRLISWEAVHDRGMRGASGEALEEALRRLERFGRVIVSSERPLPDFLERYRLSLPLLDMHHLLAFARLFLGESPTMTAEAAVLATPAVLCNPQRLGYLLAIERDYGLVHNTDTLEEGLAVAEELLASPETPATWRSRQEKLLAQTQDVVEYFLDLIRQVSKRPGKP